MNYETYLYGEMDAVEKEICEAMSDTAVRAVLSNLARTVSLLQNRVEGLEVLLEQQGLKKQ